MYFHHHFIKDSPPFHIKIMKEGMNNNYLAVQAPRGSAKSTILCFLKASHVICFQQKHHIIILQNTFSKACQSLETIKYELKENQKIKRDFKIDVVKDREGDSIFQHSDGFRIRVLCKGHEQIGSIRGEKFGAYRPDLILGDDIEDDELVLSAERREILKRQFDDVLKFAGEHGETQYIILGTILHEDSLMAKLVDKEYYPMYRKLFYKARYIDKITKKTRSIWPEKWSVEDLDKMEKEDAISFAKEMQGDPSSGLAGRFNRKDFRYWRIENMNYVLYGPESEVVAKGKLEDCRAGISCDLAWEEKRRNDSSVIMPAFLTPQSDLLIDNYICKKGLRPDEIEEILFSMEARLKSITNRPVPIGFEKAKLEKVMKWLLKKAMRDRNKFLWFKDLQWDTDKIQRIVVRLQPRYNQNVIYHRQGMGDLEHQLLKVPYGTHDDLPDALQGLVQILEYAPNKKKAIRQDNEFEWLRKKAIEARKPKRSRYVFGKKGQRRFQIPAKESYR